MDMKIDEWTPQHFRIVEQQMERGRGGILGGMHQRRCGKLKAAEYDRVNFGRCLSHPPASFTDRQLYLYPSQRVLLANTSQTDNLKVTTFRIINRQL